jgi:hypothetical protein
MSDGATLQLMRDTLIPIANAAWVGRQATLAGWILLLYDWVISFEQEVSQWGLNMELQSSKLFTGELDMGGFYNYSFKIAE